MLKELALSGSFGADYIEGTPADDVMEGGAGMDSLYGRGGNDTLDGGADNDQLSGGEGKDTYLFGRGDGQDTIDIEDDMTPGSLNVLQFKEGVSASDIVATRTGRDLVLSISGTNDSVTVTYFFYGDDPRNPYSPIQQVQFADGTRWDIDTLTAKVFAGSALNDHLAGTTSADQIHGLSGADTLVGRGGDDVLDGGAGDDSLSGDGGDDMLDGGAGDDHLAGGAGNDIYLFGRGDGQDTVDLDYNAGTDRSNELRFKEGVSAADIVTSRSGSDLLLSIAGTADSVRLSHFFYNDDPANPYNPVQQISFADGSMWNLSTILSQVAGTPGDDTLWGADGSDTLIGQGGDDRLYGRADNDLIYGDGQVGDSPAGVDGHDVVEGNEGDDQLMGGGRDDTLLGGTGNDKLFGDALGHDVPAEFHGSDFLDGGDGNDHLDGGSFSDRLLGGAGDDVLDGDGDWAGWNVHGADRLEGGAGNDTLRGQGNSDTLLGQAGDDLLHGGSENDLLYGDDSAADPTGMVSGNDRLEGNEGDDQLMGGGGNDTLEGGVGNDVLVGGAGADVYVYRRGDGRDLIWEDDATMGGADELRFGAGIAQVDLTYQQVGNDLHALISGNVGDALVLHDWYLGDSHRIETFRFADGSVHSDAQVHGLVSAMAAFGAGTSASTGASSLPSSEMRPIDLAASLMG